MKKKVPERATNHGGAKAVRFPQLSADIPNSNPCWQFSCTDKGGPFKWPKGESVELNILEKLHHFDSMRWHEIEGSDHHAIPVGSLSKEAQERLAVLKLDDTDEIFSFHYSGKARIIGIKETNLIKLLWWDPEHKVSISLKKHT